MGRIKKLRLGYFMETEATWFSPAACNKTISLTYLYVASCKRTEQQSSTGRELEESGVANFGLADLISLLHGKSLMGEQRIYWEMVGLELERFFQFPNVPSNMSLLKCSHIWEEGGGEQRIRGAATSTTSLTAQYCSLLLKGFERPSTANSLPSPLCSSSHWGLQVQGTRRGLSLSTVLCTAGKSLGDHSWLPHTALEKRALCCLVPGSSHLAVEKANNASYCTWSEQGDFAQACGILSWVSEK